MILSNPINCSRCDPNFSALLIERTVGCVPRHEVVDEGTLLIRHVQQNDGGQYTCEAWNLAGSKTTDPVNLYVHSKSRGHWEVGGSGGTGTGRQARRRVLYDSVTRHENIGLER